MKRITTLLLTLVVALGGLGLPAPVKAVAQFNGSYLTGGVNGLGDGAQLDICFETISPPYQQWGTYEQASVIWGSTVWQQALQIAIINHGLDCSTNDIDIKFFFSQQLGNDCSSYTEAAWAVPPGPNGIYGEVHFNQVCPNFQWTQGNVPITYGYMDAETIATHEIGHILGMWHDTSDHNIMNLGADCVWSRQAYFPMMSWNDSQVRTIYDGNPGPDLDKTGTFGSLVCIE